MLLRLIRSACILMLLASALSGAEPPSLRFEVTFDAKVSAQPFTGRVYIMLSKRASEPRLGPNWFQPEPIFARDVTGWKPGEKLMIDHKALAFPHPLDKLPKDTYTIQAVMDLDRGGRNFSTSPGNGYSKPVKRELQVQQDTPVSLVIDQVVAARPFAETDRVKLVDIESKLLSTFHRRPMRLQAGVILPKSFASDPKKRYPVVYEIPGFGGTHAMAQGVAVRNPTDVNGVEMLWVVLDPSCRLGHHVFADSANNGPCGQALIEELIPHLEKQFRGLGAPSARFVTGHSSGGWTSLWLQVKYPDSFGGCWSTAPDPVDFRDFQRINIYKSGENMFVDREGKQRPIARRDGKPSLYYKPFSDMDRITGRGGQLDSFDACFSPRGADGRPRPLWDRDSGVIDLEVAKYWEKYDIRLVLERGGKELQSQLKGKVHVFTGSEDTFYLEGAVVLLKESQAKLGSDAVIEIVPGRNHGNLIDRALRERINREMAETFRRKMGAANSEE